MKGGQPMRRVVCLAIVASGFLWAAAFDRCRADTIVMPSGTRFEGRVEEAGDKYILHTPTGGRMTFPKAAVKEVVHSVSGVAPPASPKPPSKPEASQDTSDVTLYAEVPLEGEFGKDIVPEGVEQCLRWCSQNANIKHVVFRVKSPGGLVQAARDIKELMQKFDDRFEYHAVVEKGISASVWVVFGCDTIHMCDEATLGAAVAFTRHVNTGSVEVDAKLNAALAAEVASLAAAKGHPGALATAMIIPGAEAYAWKQGDEVTVSASLPPDLPHTALVLQDNARTVLSLTKDQAVRIGLARPLAGGCDALGESLGLPGWRKVSDYTEKAMLRTRMNKQKADAQAKAAAERNIKQTEAVIHFIRSNVDEAAQNDPNRFTYVYKEDSGYLTAESMAKWKRQTDLALATWRRVQSGIVQLQKLEKEAEKLGLNRIVHDLNLADIYARTGREIRRLQTERGKTRP